MVLRNAAVRFGRRTLASPVSKTFLRQLSSEVTTQTSTETQPQSSWPASQAPTTPAKIVSASRKKQRIVQDAILSLATDSAHEHKGKAWTSKHKTANNAAATPAQQYTEFRRIQNTTRAIGSRVERHYAPTELISNPPGPEDVTLELLMASQTHMGHSTSLWNPANSRYIYGVREGIHIISLETTAAHLRRAARVVEEVAYRGGLILFVGNRKGQMEIVTKAAEMAGACHLFTKWTPGGITNRDVILRMHGTRVVDHHDDEIPGFDKYRGSARPLLPDLVVCLNPLENYTLLYECGLKSIPTIGVIDTNADPSWVTYTIPANDDSLRAMAVVAGVLGRAGEAGQNRRRADAANGYVSWQNPEDIANHMRKETKAAIEERKAVMGRIQQNIEGFTEEEQKILRTQFYGEELEVSEEEMLGMLGEAAADKAKETSTSASATASVGSIEKELAGLELKASMLETEIKSATRSTASPAAEAEVEVKAEAPLASDSALSGIEEQLAAVAANAAEIEAELKPSNEKSE